MSGISVGTARLAGKGPRLLWLDGFRGAAVLLMIETHVVNSFLPADLRNPAWFSWLNYLNGLVAPSFLFIAGFAMGLAVRTSSTKPVAWTRKIGRLAGVLAFGYLMHFPFAEVSQGRWGEALRLGTQMDVLPCLALALSALLILQRLARCFPEGGREGVWMAGAGLLAGLAAIGAPLMKDWNGGAIPIVACVNQSTGSLFPLLPWAAFVFAGAWRGAMPETGWRFSSAWLGAGLAAGWWRGHVVFSSLSPAFVVERLAWVLLLAEACQAGRIWEKAGWVRLAGRESLLMYAVHLLIISTVLATHVVGRPGWLEIGLMFTAVLGGTYAVALARIWRPWKTREPGRLCYADVALARRWRPSKTVPLLVKPAPLPVLSE